MRAFSWCSHPRPTSNSQARQHDAEKHSVTDTVAGLEGGADDYIAKPFRFEELLARIRLRLRDDQAAEATVLAHGDLTLDLRTRRAHLGGAYRRPHRP